MSALPNRAQVARAATSRARLRHAQRVRRKSKPVARPLTKDSRDYDPLVHRHKGAGRSSAVVAGLLGLAVLAHVGVLVAFAVVSATFRREAPPASTDETLEVGIVETTPEREEDAQPEPARAAPDEARPKPPPEPASADPVDEAAKPPPNTSQPIRRVVGLTFDSTVAGGGGPSFAVGNTRMGKTATTAEAPEEVETVNEKATRIPAVGVKYAAPVRTSSVKPEYPELLKRQGIEGDVVVLLKLDEQGRVIDVRVLKPSPYEEFNQAAVNTAWKETYKPAVRNGKAVSYNLRYTYRFRLEGT